MLYIFAANNTFITSVRASLTLQYTEPCRIHRALLDTECYGHMICRPSGRNKTATSSAFLCFLGFLPAVRRGILCSIG